MQAIRDKVIRDKGFARRIETACENHPHAPSGHGRQKWVREQLEAQGTTVSPEAVRKWFAGEARPKPAMMKQLASILEVDEAWLSLAIVPDVTPREQSKLNAQAAGAVNYVAGLIQMGGGTIAFPEESEGHSADIFAIISGKRRSIQIKTVVPSDNHLTLKFVPAPDDTVLLAVVPATKLGDSKVYRVPFQVISESGESRGGFTELKGTISGSTVRFGPTAVTPIKGLKDLL